MPLYLTPCPSGKGLQVANVIRAVADCESTLTILENLDRWLGQTERAVIHFGAGLYPLSRQEKIPQLGALAPPHGRCAGPGPGLFAAIGAQDRITGPLCPFAPAAGVLGSPAGGLYSARLLPPATTLCKPASTTGSKSFRGEGAPLSSPSSWLATQILPLA